MLGTGVDIVQISAFSQLVSDPSCAFVKDHFTAGELAYCEVAHGTTALHLAARYAAKEAAIKAFEEAHLFRPRLLLKVDYREIEVCKDPSGRPYLNFSGYIATIVSELQAKAFLSLSHDGDYAIAQVILS